jgi:hypothetical protein
MQGPDDPNSHVSQSNEIPVPFVPPLVVVVLVAGITNAGASPFSVHS